MQQISKRVFLEIYGCQMNVNDAEIVMSILQKKGYTRTDQPQQANVHLLMTCAIRENAERKIFTRLSQLRAEQVKQDRDFKVGILGCMAERLKEKLFEQQVVDIVCGPDAYRDLPRLLAKTELGQSGANTQLSLEETYADIVPVRLDSDNQVSAFLSIMRGCDNMCTFCIVPFVRGRERSRSIQTIVDEVKRLRDAGVKDITLLGQNVNSYRDVSQETEQEPTKLADGFKTVYKPKLGGLRFTTLLEKCSIAAPEVRFRFTSPHPKDFPDDLFHLIQERPNICKSLHLPLQSGSTSVLERMRRGYSKESFLSLAEKARMIIPEVTLSTDIIAGFCGETETDHQDTLEVMRRVRFEQAFMFAYSQRPKTPAARKYEDDVPDVVKQSRLHQVIETFQMYRPQTPLLNTRQLVLVDGKSKKDASLWKGRTDGNHLCVLNQGELGNLQPGDYVEVDIHSSTPTTVYGHVLRKSSLQEFYQKQKQFDQALMYCTG